MSSTLKFIEYCEKCFALWPEDESVSKCPNTSCSGQRYRGNPLKKVKKSFILTSCLLKEQLKAILDRDGMWEKVLNVIKSRESNNGDCITDVTDGKRYRELCQPGGVLHGTENLTIIFNTDGVALYKSSRIEIWPVYVAINEIPAKERFQCKNVALWGLWQGKGKPPTYAFTKPLVEALREIAIDGLMLTSGKRIKFYTLISTMDLIAKAQILCMNQHNGFHGCSTCLIKGVHEKNVHVYPYSEAIDQKKSAKRNDEKTFNDAIKAISSGQKVNGIKGPSSLHLIPEFSITDGVVPDYMHGVLLGVAKVLVACWFDPSEHRIFYKENRTYPEYYIGHMIHDVDVRLEGMRPVDYISRRPRPLSGNLGHLKANELRTWLLYYSLPCLEGILLPIYWNHLALLVEATHILLGEKISKTDLEWANDCLQLFYKYFSEFYERRKSGLNIHNLIHLPLYVEYWGPLWAYSCFGFESLNGSIIKQVHGTKNGSTQIIKTFNALKAIHIMMQSQNTKEIVRNALSSMLMKNRRLANYLCLIFVSIIN
uniref:Transposase domain-containing protein n=4 Tax=Clytia hemisphaerica TaxID=252671 RepID=A0A7M5XKF2_9CNID